METTLSSLRKSLILMGVDFEIHRAERSTYVKLSNCGRVKQIRISDHEGHKSSRNCWELRKDRSTQRVKKIFAFNDVRLMVDMLFAEKVRRT